MMKAIITVTSSLSDEQYKSICDGFIKKYGCDLCFEKRIDDGIIGGFIADIDGEIYDTSISSQLEKMSKHINRQ